MKALKKNNKMLFKLFKKTSTHSDLNKTNNIKKASSNNSSISSNLYSSDSYI